MKKQNGFQLVSLCCIVFIFSIFSSPAAALAADVDLIRNGSFSSGMSEWYVNPEIGADWDPLVNGAVDLHPPDYGYTGMVIFQNQNVTGIGGATFNLTVRLTTTTPTPPAGNTIAFYLTFVDMGNAVHKEKILSPDNAAIPQDPNDPGSVFTAPYTFPAVARKLVKIEVVKENNGPFVVDDIMLKTGAAVTLGALPNILSLSSSTGAYPSSLAITGTGFGTTAPVVKIGGSENGVTLTTFSDTRVAVTIQDPARSGQVQVIADFTESNINHMFDITSPNYTVDGLLKKLVAVKGQTAEFVYRLDFLNGFTTQTGVNFILQGLPLETGAAFLPVPVKNPGGVLLKIDTATLDAGIYPFVVQASDGTAAARLASGSLEVVTIDDINFSRTTYDSQTQTNITENLTRIDLTAQGSLGSYGLTIEAMDSQGNTWNTVAPFDSNIGSPLTVSSSNPSVLLVETGTWGPDFYALGAGSANIVVTATDGTTKSLPVTVTIGQTAPRISIAASPPVINHNYTGDINFSATGNYALTSVWSSTSGMVNFSSNFSENGSYYDGNRSYGSTFQLQDQEPGIFNVLFSATTSDGSTSATGYAQLQITADPTMGQIRGGVRLVDDSFAESFDLEFYGLEDGTTPVFTREMFMFHGAKNFHLAGIPLGTYKLRLSSPEDMVIPQWYDNADSFATAAPVTIAPGILDNIYFFNRGYPLISFTGSVKLGGETYPAQGIDNAVVQVVDSGNIWANTDASGDFTLTGIRADANFELSITKSGYTPVYSKIFNSDQDIKSLLSYSLFPTGILDSLGNTAGNGVVMGRVCQFNAPATYIDGAEVTAVNADAPTQIFPVVYQDPSSGTFGGGTTTYGNGLFAVLNVPADITVKLTAAKSGWTFVHPTAFVKTRADALCQTSFFGTSVDEPVLVSGFEGAIAALNAKDLEGFMSFVSQDYFDAGTNRAQFESEISQMIQAGETMAYEINSIAINGDTAIMAIVWNASDADTLYFKKETQGWKLYGDQQKYTADLHSGHTADAFWVGMTVADPDKAITSVSVAGPGITGTIDLIYNTEQKEWVSWQTAPPYTNFGPDFGTNPPAPPLTYTFTVVEDQASSSFTGTMTSFVSAFATPIAPGAGQAVSPLTSFSWTGLGTGYTYGIELSDENWVRLWNVYDITGTSAAYTGPALVPGSYYYSLQARDSEDNFSMVSVPFSVISARGDINEDGKLDLVDVNLTLKVLTASDSTGLTPITGEPIQTKDAINTLQHAGGRR